MEWSMEMCLSRVGVLCFLVVGSISDTVNWIFMPLNAGEDFETSGCFEGSSVPVDPTPASAVSRHFAGCMKRGQQVGYGSTADGWGRSWLCSCSETINCPDCLPESSMTDSMQPSPVADSFSPLTFPSWNHQECTLLAHLLLTHLTCVIFTLSPSVFASDCAPSQASFPIKFIFVWPVCLPVLLT